VSHAQALAHGELRVLGRIAEASNTTLLCEVQSGERVLRCVYKPAAGERPLWDFPGAVLAGREVLTARAAEAFGWDLVPETVWRADGPGGAGMCQAWVDADDGDPPIGLFPAGRVPAGWREVAQGRAEDGGLVVLAHESSAGLQRLAVLDALVNNGDRKGGHVLRRADGSVAGIDHGVTFHPEPKLRTVLWGWAGEPIPGWLCDELRDGAGQFGAILRGAPAALGDAEVGAATDRLSVLLDEGTFPVPGGDWPALPWPPM
jgi:uncharacterized repeat protein (TIGR03843 family)